MVYQNQERGFNLLEALDLPSAFEQGLSGGAESLRSLRRAYGDILERGAPIQPTLLPVDYAVEQHDLPDVDIDQAVSARGDAPWSDILHKMQAHRPRPHDEAVVVAIARWRARHDAVYSDPDLFRLEFAAECIREGVISDPGWHVQRWGPQEWIKSVHIPWHGISPIVAEMQRILKVSRERYIEHPKSTDEQFLSVGLTAFWNVAQATRQRVSPPPAVWNMAMSHAMCRRRGWLTGDVEEPTRVERVLRPITGGIRIDALTRYAASGNASGIIAQMQENQEAVDARTRYTNVVHTADRSVEEAIGASRIVEEHLLGNTTRRNSFAEVVFYRYPLFVVQVGTR